MNWARTRSLFPVTEQIVYLNHAGVAPISSRVAEALTRYAQEASRRGAFDYDRSFDAEVERVRGRAAQLLAVDAEELAFVKNTTEGLGLVATGLDWRAGDRVVTCDLEYPSNVYPWWALRERGVETLMLRGRDGRVPLDELAVAVRDPRVRLVALSSVQFGSGARTDLERVGSLCREAGVLLCVDAIQSLGCLPLEPRASGIDFLAADGHKWLLAMEGCGLFYCARPLLDRLQPRLVGWRSVRNNRDFDHYQTELQPGAGRFEEGTTNTAGIFGLGAAVDLILELGIDAIAGRVLALTDRLVEGLRRCGARVHSPRGPGEASGIVAFTLDGEPPARTVSRLRARHFFLVQRRGCARASPHFYNSEDEVDALLEALRAP